jgi:hypothetical protein
MGPATRPADEETVTTAVPRAGTLGCKSEPNARAEPLNGGAISLLRFAALVSGLCVAHAALGASPTVTSEDVARHLSGPADDTTVRAALRRAIDQALLRDEATRHLPPSEAALPASSARLLTTLFSPNALCQRFPEPARRALFDAARWRFQMPTAWQVTSIDWRCCSGAACEHPAAAACREQGHEFMKRLRQELPDTIDDTEFGSVFDARRPLEPRLRFERYTFFYDPDTPESRGHRRLRHAAAPIRAAVSNRKAGDLIGPIRTRQGHTLLRLRARRPRVHFTWADPRTQAALRTELCPARLQRARSQYLSDLRQQSPVAIDYAGIEAAWGVTLTPARPQ